jgi:hypothetical protein
MRCRNSVYIARCSHIYICELLMHVPLQQCLIHSNSAPALGPCWKCFVFNTYSGNEEGKSLRHIRLLIHLAKSPRRSNFLALLLSVQSVGLCVARLDGLLSLQKQWTWFPGTKIAKQQLLHNDNRFATIATRKLGSKVNFFRE